MLFLPRLLQLTIGPAIIEIDPEGNALSHTEISAAIVDLCAVLADP